MDYLPCESYSSKLIKIGCITEKCCKKIKDTYIKRHDIDQINNLISDKIADYIKFAMELNTFMQMKLENDINNIINKYPNHYVFGNKSIDRITVITNEIERYCLSILEKNKIDETKKKELYDYITDYMYNEMKKYLDRPNTITNDELTEIDCKLKGIINSKTH